MVVNFELDQPYKTKIVDIKIKSIRNQELKGHET